MRPLSIQLPLFDAPSREGTDEESFEGFSRVPHGELAAEAHHAVADAIAAACDGGTDRRPPVLVVSGLGGLQALPPGLLRQTVAFRLDTSSLGGPGSSMFGYVARQGARLQRFVAERYGKSLLVVAHIPLLLLWDQGAPGAPSVCELVAQFFTAGVTRLLLTIGRADVARIGDAFELHTAQLPPYPPCGTLLTTDDAPRWICSVEVRQQLKGALAHGLNVLLLGPPGVGKTTALRSLPALIQPELADVDCLLMDRLALEAGIYRGQIEERLREALVVAKRRKRRLLAAFDEMLSFGGRTGFQAEDGRVVVAATSTIDSLLPLTGGQNAADLPALQFVGTSTPEDATHLAAFSAFWRRVTVITIPAPTAEDLRAIVGQALSEAELRSDDSTIDDVVGAARLAWTESSPARELRLVRLMRAAGRGPFEAVRGAWGPLAAPNLDELVRRCAPVADELVGRRNEVAAFVRGLRNGVRRLVRGDGTPPELLLFVALTGSQGIGKHALARAVGRALVGPDRVHEARVEEVERFVREHRMVAGGVLVVSAIGAVNAGLPRHDGEGSGSDGVESLLRTVAPLRRWVVILVLDTSEVTGQRVERPLFFEDPPLAWLPMVQPKLSEHEKRAVARDLAQQLALRARAFGISPPCLDALEQEAAHGASPHAIEAALLKALVPDGEQAGAHPPPSRTGGRVIPLVIGGARAERR